LPRKVFTAESQSTQRNFLSFHFLLRGQKVKNNSPLGVITLMGWLIHNELPAFHTSHRCVVTESYLPSSLPCHSLSDGRSTANKKSFLSVLCDSSKAGGEYSGVQVIVKGAVHMHTTLSHDGKLSLPQLAGFLGRRGHDFIMVTEHSFDVSESDMAKLESQADALSMPDFLVVPGLEFRCDHDIEIAAPGVTRLCTQTDPAHVIAHIHEQGGVAILAHPYVRNYPIDPAWVQYLDAVEIWNVANEGKYIPNPSTLRKCRALSAAHQGLNGITALDLHDRRNYCRLFVHTKVERLDRAALLGSLRQGTYSCRSPFFHSNARVNFSRAYLLYVDVLRSIRNLVRRTVRRD
jgi:hypothetical protein